MLVLVNFRGKKIRQYKYLKGKQSEAGSQNAMQQHPELLRKAMGAADVRTPRLSFITKASLWHSSKQNTCIPTSQLSFIKTNKQNLGRIRHYKYKWKSWWTALTQIKTGIYLNKWCTQHTCIFFFKRERTIQKFNNSLNLKSLYMIKLEEEKDPVTSGLMRGEQKTK